MSAPDYELAQTGKSPSDLVGALVRIGAVGEDELIGFLSELFFIELLAPDALPDFENVRTSAAHLNLPHTWLIANAIIVWRSGDGAYNAAGPALYDAALQEALEQLTKTSVRLFLAAPGSIRQLLDGLGAGSANASARAEALDPKRLAERAEEAPVIDFVNAVFAEALQRRASDVHFEPFEDKLIVRLRIDGVLSVRRSGDVQMFDAVASRIKLLSGMNIAERRLPQDGRQSIRVAGRDIDVRVSSLPTTWGESIVVRLLGATHKIPALSELGLRLEQRTLLGQAIKAPHGLVLVTGPTGSGKTTTVYRLLSELNDGVRKIVTIEDPVEFDLPGVMQMGVRSDIDLDFAAGLRSILRQDPDVIFVGEIRDRETAQTAVQAALTGHLVISTVHTNSALGAVSRLHDLGVEPFLFGEVLRAVVSQRLLRCLCPSCVDADGDALHIAKAQAALNHETHEKAPLWQIAKGCKDCAHTGYRGRIGAFETVRISPALQEAIRTRAGETQLNALARQEGFTSLMQAGLLLAREGRTSIVEALRVLNEAT
ncbi:GspE/PulE family protein [Candidatus Viadribacter manganicus]|uniref:GspE/PulE family protein n=1 Tax=Candidatus Viadribacter manganicus TaxID=1759059 RepID=UPI001D17B83B|nr:ATPase, T2SS/T4P/T4SS family [Candidatus Viadribacter manganicus]